jgi:hypothetical protein
MVLMVTFARYTLLQVSISTICTHSLISLLLKQFIKLRNFNQDQEYKNFPKIY